MAKRKIVYTNSVVRHIYNCGHNEIETFTDLDDEEKCFALAGCLKCDKGHLVEVNISRYYHNAKKV